MLPVNDFEPTKQIGRREIDLQGSDTMWKLNPVLEQLHSHQLPITHAKLLTKETKYGAEH